MHCALIRRVQRHFDTVVFAGAFCSVAAVPVKSQISGVVRDSATRAPISGAVVSLLGPDRVSQARTLTTADGAFRLSDGPVTTIRVVRIGYRPAEVSIERPLAGPVTVALASLGGLLNRVNVQVNPVCPQGRSQREALALWGTARDGLLALLVASSNQSGSVSQLLFDRTLDSDGRTIVRQAIRRVETGSMAPVRAGRDASELARSGYVERKQTSSVYYAPDAGVLLDSTFAELHCLTTRADRAKHPNEIGIAFLPIRGRQSIPDIEGVLWLTDRPAALHSLEYEYRGIDPAIAATHAGGRLDFATLSSGSPIIQYWHIRSPRVMYLPAGSSSRRGVRIDGEIASVGELHEGGGLIASGAFADGTAFHLPLASISGTVVSGVGTSPIAGAMVTLDSAGLAPVRTDHDGRFSFDTLLPGPYVVRVVDSLVTPRPTNEQHKIDLSDSSSALEVVARSRILKVNVKSGVTNSVEIRLPWRDGPNACYPKAGNERRFVVIGELRTQDSAVVSNAAVHLTWIESAKDTASTTIAEARSDQTGRFIICGVPASNPISIRVTSVSGAEYRGSMRVPESVSDAAGRPVAGTLRPVTIIVLPHMPENQLVRQR